MFVKYSSFLTLPTKKKVQVHVCFFCVLADENWADFFSVSGPENVFSLCEYSLGWEVQGPVLKTYLAIMSVILS